MRRICLLLLIALLLPLPALGESAAERLAQLDIISQYDKRLEDERYYYKNMLFRIAGCLPASITNAVVALLGDADTPTPEVMVELRNGLVYDRSNKEASVDLHRLPDYLRTPRDTATELRKLLKPVTSVSMLSLDMTAQPAEKLLTQFLTSDDAHPLLIRPFYFPDSWLWLTNAAQALCNLGYPDARIALCAVGVGTIDTDGPFNLGQSGHYATVYFQADEFYNDGTFYLLDSYPRALAGEIYGYREHYPIRYPFVEKPKSTFSNTYAATRISDTVVQFTLLPAELELLHSAKDEDHIPQLLRQCTTAIMYSDPYFMLYVP